MSKVKIQHTLNMEVVHEKSYYISVCAAFLEISANAHPIIQEGQTH
jgi:hypothetical protein